MKFTQITYILAFSILIFSLEKASAQNEVFYKTYLIKDAMVHPSQAGFDTARKGRTAFVIPSALQISGVFSGHMGVLAGNILFSEPLRLEPYKNKTANGYSLLNVRAEVDVFGFIYRIKKNNSEIRIFNQMVFSQRFHMHDHLVGLMVNGNKPFVGKNYDNFADFGSATTVYNKSTIGYMRNFLKKKLAIGTHLHYYHGFADARFSIYDSRMHTEANGEYITVSGKGMARATYPAENEIEFNKSLIKEAKGAGFGASIGARYQLNKKTTFTANLTDFGYIKWKAPAINYNFEGNVDYKGVNIFDSAYRVADTETLIKEYSGYKADSSKDDYTVRVPGFYEFGVHYDVAKFFSTTLLFTKQFPMVSPQITLLARLKTKGCGLIINAGTGFTPNFQLGAHFYVSTRGFNLYLGSSHLGNIMILNRNIAGSFQLGMGFKI